jgi:putative MATE family efflux protein
LSAGSSPPGHDRKHIFSLAWPVILNNIFLTLVWMVDMMMVGRLGPNAVAAVGVSGQMFTMIMAITLAVTTGTIALVARYTGAKDKDKANTVLGQSLLLGAILSGLLMTPGLAASDGLFRLFGAEASVTKVGSPYLRIVLTGTVFIVVALVSSSALRGAGDTKTPLVISVAANMVNVLLNYALIFGKFGMPRLEVIGAGIATVTAFALEAAAFLFLLWKGNLVLSLPKKVLRLEKETALKTLRIGSPSAVEQGIIQAGYLWYMAVITRYGTDPLAAYMIGVNIMSLSFLPGFGFSVAASALVGQSLGAREPAAASSQGWECSKMAVWVMSSVGVVLFIAARPIAFVYVSDTRVVTLTAEFVRILAVCQPAMALHFTLSGALVGAADTRWPLYGSFAGMYLIRMPLALLAAYGLGMNITWIWLIIVADHYGKAAVVFLRFLSGQWKEVAV